VLSAALSPTMTMDNPEFQYGITGLGRAGTSWTLRVDDVVAHGLVR
jgi:hypothetical protein